MIKFSDKKSNFPGFLLGIKLAMYVSEEGAEGVTHVHHKQTQPLLLEDIRSPALSVKWDYVLDNYTVVMSVWIHLA